MGAKVGCGEDVWQHITKRRFKLVFLCVISQISCSLLLSFDLGLLLPFNVTFRVKNRGFPINNDLFSYQIYTAHSSLASFSLSSPPVPPTDTSPAQPFLQLHTPTSDTFSSSQIRLQHKAS